MTIANRRMLRRARNQAQPIFWMLWLLAFLIAGWVMIESVVSHGARVAAATLG